MSAGKQKVTGGARGAWQACNLRLGGGGDT
jgi:hypothetical protein